MIYKLGKRRPRDDYRTLRLGTYLKLSELPPDPPAVDWSENVASFPMMLNSDIGDCTCASSGHMIQVWTAAAGAEVVPSDDSILAAYRAVGDYDPARPETDQGAVLLDVLKHWRKTGIAGRQIGAFVQVRRGELAMIRAACHLFGGLDIGLALPLSAQNQGVWDVTTGPDSPPGTWGGHCVNLIGYDPDGLTCVTWGERKRMTWQFFTAYCDEAWAILSRDFLRGDGTTPDGFDLQALNADLSVVG